MKYKHLSLLSFIFSIFLIIIQQPTITGNVVGSLPKPFSFLPYAILALSATLAATGKQFDYIIIPTGPLKAEYERRKTAVEAYRKYGAEHVIVSGARPGKRDQNQWIKDGLVALGIPEEIILEEDHAHTSLENVVDSAEVIHQRNPENKPVRIGVVTSKRHGNRFRLGFLYAKKEGLLPKKSSVHIIPTKPYSPLERIREWRAAKMYKANLKEKGLMKWYRERKSEQD